jgi:hypothetical protein
MPIVAIAIVTGSKTTAKGVGEATSSSSVPCHRSRCIAAPALVLVADQIPITEAPSDAYSSVSAEPPAWNMKKATVPKKSGYRMFSSPLNGSRMSIFRWISQPMASTRAVFTAGRYSSATSAT